MQIHDFNPGFGPAVSPVGSNGFGTRTFWTTAIDDDDVTVQFGAGKAEMRVDNLSIRDYGTRKNANGPHFQTAFDPAVVSFDVVWDRLIMRRVSVPDGTLGNNYAGDYVENQVTVTWSGKNLATGFTFTANPGTFATSSFDGGFAELGKERNGSFVSSDSGESDRVAAADTLAPPSLVLPPPAGILAAPPVVAALPEAGTPQSTSHAVQPVTTGFPSESMARMIALTGAAPSEVSDQVFADLDSGASFGTL